MAGYGAMGLMDPAVRAQTHPTNLQDCRRLQVDVRKMIAMLFELGGLGNCRERP